MGFFSKLFGNKKKDFQHEHSSESLTKLPIGEISEAYTRYFTAFSKEIIELLQEKGFVGGTGGQVRIDIKDAAKFGNIITEYALFLKAIIVYTIKTNLNSFSSADEKALNKAFTTLDQLTEAQKPIPRYKKIIDNRVNHYLSSAESKQVRGYCAQNVLGLNFVETLSTRDNPRFSLMFADCVYYILKREDFATLENLDGIKVMAKNETANAARAYMAFSDKVIIHADLLTEEIKRILINR